MTALDMLCFEQSPNGCPLLRGVNAGQADLVLDLIGINDGDRVASATPTTRPCKDCAGGGAHSRRPDQLKASSAETHATVCKITLTSNGRNQMP